MSIGARRIRRAEYKIFSKKFYEPVPRPKFLTEKISSRGRNSCWADLNEALRNESPPKQADLAKVLDIHVTYISGIERGIRNMSLKNIEKLSKALKVPIEELIK